IYSCIVLFSVMYCFFFFQAEDGIRDRNVTGVQTCALPISAFKIGIFQALSIIPGTSRSGSTIIGGLLVGTSRHIATEFSFFLSIPAMFGASLVKLLDLGFAFTTVEWIYLLFGMFIAFIVSVFEIKFLLNYLKRNDFTGFGKYRIVLGAIVILYSLFQFKYLNYKPT